MASFNIELRTGTSLHPDGEPSDFVSEYTGVVTCTDDETGAVAKVGRLAAMRVHVALAHNAGESLFDVCDCHSSELNYLHALLYEPERYHFREEVMARFDAADPDLLVLDYVVLAPKWRKLKLGLLAVRKLVDLIGGGCGLAVSDISPLRRDAASLLRVPARWLTRYAGREERRAATVRLRRYYRRMGFSRLGRTPYYALPLNQVTPTATELLEPM
ncbi:hypothetical protein R5W24_002133 [Gemmata sp. JC717]|uniref:hypothetical protein n=1 Tax=Gemmata algarum TaxID=2975278 RepID=UPI0021BA5725|nr:hypothetical protein [Gemmata algarum]MDY3553043.1 hypothetical protein [Gemmata algarum]